MYGSVVVYPLPFIQFYLLDVSGSFFGFCAHRRDA